MPINYGILAPNKQQAEPLLGQATPAPNIASSSDDTAGLLKGVGSIVKALKNDNGMPEMPGTSNVNPTPNDPSQYAGNNQGALKDQLYGLAKGHLGENERDNAPVLMSVLGKMNGEQVDPRTTPWCAGFVNGVLQAGGVKGSGSLAARSLLNWGTPTDKPSIGDVVVLSRGSDPNKGHTGFFAGYNNDGSIKVLGGNQGNNGSVSVETFPTDRVLGYRSVPSAQDITKAVAPKDAHPSLPVLMAGIAHVESSGESDPYALKSKATGHDRAYGKYQIMGKNIPSWTKAATGQKLTPDQFLADPAAQEKTAAYMLNESLKQGYTPDDAASIWFSGRPQNKAGHSKDAYGTTVPQYIHKFREGATQYMENIKNNTPAPQSQNSNPSPQMQLSRTANPGLLANSKDPNQPPNIPAFDPHVPIRNLSPEEQAAVMRWNGNKSNGYLG